MEEDPEGRNRISKTLVMQAVDLASEEGLINAVVVSTLRKSRFLTDADVALSLSNRESFVLEVTSNEMRTCDSQPRRNRECAEPTQVWIFEAPHSETYGRIKVGLKGASDTGAVVIVSEIGHTSNEFPRSRSQHDE